METFVSFVLKKDIFGTSFGLRFDGTPDSFAPPLRESRELESQVQALSDLVLPPRSGMADEASGDRGRRKRDAPQKAIEGASEQAGKATKGAKAKPTKDATGPKKEPKAATNRGKGQKEANEVGASGGAGAKEPEEDIKALYDVPECPVFFPTAKEFNHPVRGIASLPRTATPMLMPWAMAHDTGQVHRVHQRAGATVRNLQDRAAPNVEATIHDRPQSLHRAHPRPASELSRWASPAAPDFCRKPLSLLVVRVLSVCAHVFIPSIKRPPLSASEQRWGLKPTHFTGQNAGRSSINCL